MVRARRMGGGGGGGGGSGTVTSVGLAMPAIFSVAGSPVTTSGTITVTLATQAANAFLGGPASGAAAAPTFRALVAADYPAMVGDSGAGGTRGAVPAPAAGDATKFLRGDGTWVAVSGSGTVTSVGLSAPADFSVSGSPVTGSGTLAFTWANQSANRVLAGPNSGGAATPTFRALVGDDIPTLAKSKISATGSWAAAEYVTMVGDSGAGGTKGAVPAPAAGDAAAGKFLKADGTWAVPSGGGGSGWSTGTGTVYLTTSTDKVGIGNTAPTQALTIGTGGLMTSGNTSAVIVRAFTTALDSGDDQGHGWSDCSTINVTTNTFAYASMDVKTVVTGSANYGHFVGVQINPTYGSSGSTLQVWGLLNAPVINSGNVTSHYGIMLKAPIGTGTYTNGTQLYIEETTAGSSTNYSIVAYGVSVVSRSSAGNNRDVLWVQNAGGTDNTSASIVFQAYSDTTTPTCRVSGRRLGTGIFGLDFWTFDYSLGCTKALTIDDLGNTMALRGVLGGKGFNQPIVTKTGNYTIVRRTDYTVLADTSGGGFTITLPASPTTGDIYIVRKVSASNTLTIARNGKNINGAASDLSVTTDGEVNRLQYDSTSGSWWTI